MAVTDVPVTVTTVPWRMMPSRAPPVLGVARKLTEALARNVVPMG